MKACNKCKESKSLDEFYSNKKSKDGKQYTCKICSKQITHKWMGENQEHNKSYSDKWRKNNPDYHTQHKKDYNLILENKLKYVIRSNYNNVIPKEHRHDLIEILGCDINTYIKYIESLWLKEFSWDNYGKIWEIDHIIPRSSVEFKTLKSQRHIFGYKNTRPLFKTSEIAKSYGYNNIIGNKNKGDKQKTRGVRSKIIT